MIFSAACTQIHFLKACSESLQLTVIPFCLHLQDVLKFLVFLRTERPPFGEAEATIAHLVHGNGIGLDRGTVTPLAVGFPLERRALTANHWPHQFGGAVNPPRQQPVPRNAGLQIRQRAVSASLLCGRVYALCSSMHGLPLKTEHCPPCLEL